MYNVESRGKMDMSKFAVLTSIAGLVLLLVLSSAFAENFTVWKDAVVCGAAHTTLSEALDYTDTGATSVGSADVLADYGWVIIEEGTTDATYRVGTEIVYYNRKDDTSDQIWITRRGEFATAANRHNIGSYVYQVAVSDIFVNDKGTGFSFFLDICGVQADHTSTVASVSILAFAATVWPPDDTFPTSPAPQTWFKIDDTIGKFTNGVYAFDVDNYTASIPCDSIWAYFNTPNAKAFRFIAIPTTCQESGFAQDADHYIVLNGQVWQK